MGTDSHILLASVSLLSALQMGYMARRVGLSRKAHRVLPPLVTGPPEFERTFRAHQNSVECYPLFLVILWICGVFFSEVTAATVGLLYIFARQIYFNGYVKSAKNRLSGFYLTLVVFATLSLLGFFGILLRVLHKYFDIDF